MDTDVVVIGAGVAGLAAAQALRAAGLDTLLIEARDRIGGRLWTLHPPGWPLPVELGAEFIHGEPEELRDLAAEPATDRHDRGAELAGTDRLFERMRAIAPPLPDCSFEQFLHSCCDFPVSALASARAFIEGFEAADPGRISVFSLNRERQAAAEDGAGDLAAPRRPQGGYAELLRRLPAPVKLGCVVERIRWRRGGVAVEAMRGSEPIECRARRALITLPLGVLQARPHLFAPLLPRKQAALAGLVMGGALRVTLRLQQALWEQAGFPHLGFLFAEPGETGHFPVWWVGPGDAAQTTGWAAGRHAWALAGNSPEHIRSRAVADLAAALALPVAKLESELVAAHCHDWQVDPFSLGAYSYARTGSADAFALLAAPVEGTLFFAGEATENSGRHATVHGALRSARRAVAEITARA